MVRKIRCKVCHYRFVPKEENKKVIKDLIRSYEAFDCPQCGCKNIVNTIEGIPR